MSSRRAAPFDIVSAFANTPFGGNPAAVVFLDSEADAKLDSDTLAKIAHNFQQPMTAFVYNSDESKSEDAETAKYDIRWFTPTAIEVAICGHATLAAAAAIFARGLVKTQVTTLEFRARKTGTILRIFKHPSGKFEISLPRSNTILEVPMGDELFGITGVVLSEFENPEIVFIGHGGPGFEDYLLIELELKGSKTLGDYQVDAQAMRSTGYMINIVTTRSPTADASFVSRMFSPKALPADRAEDQVSASTHSLLAPYWQRKLGLGQEFKAKQSSVGPGGRRTGIDKAHVPFRGNDPSVGRKTGIRIQEVARNSDGFEDFNGFLDQQYVGVEAPTQRKTKGKGKAKKGKDVDQEMDDDDDPDDAMDVVDSPVQNIRPPNTPRLSRPSARASRVSQVDFDEVPSPRPLSHRRSTPGPSPLKRSAIPPALSAKEYLQQDEGLSDDDFAGPAGGYDDYGGGQDYDEEDSNNNDNDNDGERNMSFTEMHSRVETDDEFDIPEQPVLSSSPRKGKRKAPSDDDDDMEDEIAQGMRDVDMDQDLPPSDDQSPTPPPSPPRKKLKTSSRPTAEEILPPTDEDEDDNVQQSPPPKKKPAKATKPKADKPKNVIIKSRGQKENRDVPEGVRRSKRVPILPLEWWRLEKYEYGGRSEVDKDHGPVLVPHIRAIVRVPKEPVVPLGSKRRRRRSSSAPASTKGKVKVVEKIVEVHVDTENPEEGWDDETATQAFVKSYHTGEQVQRRIAFTAKMFKPTVGANSQWSYQRVFGDGDFIAAGQIVIPPNGRKPSKPSKDNTFIFYVIQGAVNLRICDTSLIIATGGMFMIPRGNTYFIENIAERDAKLFFTQARKMRVGEKDGDEEAEDEEVVVISAGKGKNGKQQIVRAASLANPALSSRGTSNEAILRRGKSLNV
ncbi:CENP-C-C domain-containing protein [Mycena chlorophos]|uniref:CENP-C homolog n=1 Tax=Mycena chlorophos TaxID=658473 RepID=A0A8H6RYH9_MYCCL|nr:CENP-C-C domain-containing protein [Mycena chlorophos]